MRNRFFILMLFLFIHHTRPRDENCRILLQNEKSINLSQVVLGEVYFHTSHVRRIFRLHPCCADAAIKAKLLLPFICGNIKHSRTSKRTAHSTDNLCSCAERHLIALGTNHANRQLIKLAPVSKRREHEKQANFRIDNFQKPPHSPGRPHYPRTTAVAVVGRRRRCPTRTGRRRMAGRAESARDLRCSGLACRLVTARPWDPSRSSDSATASGPPVRWKTGPCSAGGTSGRRHYLVC